MPRICIHENCMKIPAFNFINETTALFCRGHKKETMIDIKHKRCIHENCMTRPTFN